MSSVTSAMSTAAKRIAEIRANWNQGHTSDFFEAWDRETDRQRVKLGLEGDYPISPDRKAAAEAAFDAELRRMAEKAGRHGDWRQAVRAQSLEFALQCSSQGDDADKIIARAAQYERYILGTSQ